MNIIELSNYKEFNEVDIYCPPCISDVDRFSDKTIILYHQCNPIRGKKPLNTYGEKQPTNRIVCRRKRNMRNNPNRETFHPDDCA